VLLARVVVFLLGVALVWETVSSAVRTFVLPRGAPDFISGVVFIGMRRLFDLRLRGEQQYKRRDRIMAFYGPVAVLSLLPAWLILLLLGYTAMYWGLGAGTWRTAFDYSGSSLLTLGLTSLDSTFQAALGFSEAALGLILVALLIAFLPTIYSAFSKREAAVAMLEVRAGTPPSCIEMLGRYHRIHGLSHLHEVWSDWEIWFSEIEESHTSLAALAFFRSPQPDRSWVTASGAVLDTASLVNAALDIPHDPQADLCIRSGYLALRRIADYFGITYDMNPRSTDPISIKRSEFDAVLDELSRQGLQLKSDRDKAWRDFQGWRVNYDTVLLTLADLTMAPYAPWSSDRRIKYRPRPLIRRLRR
jgi:hypothetical protein